MKDKTKTKKNNNILPVKLEDIEKITSTVKAENIIYGFLDAILVSWDMK